MNALREFLSAATAAVLLQRSAWQSGQKQLDEETKDTARELLRTLEPLTGTTAPARTDQ